MSLFKSNNKIVALFNAIRASGDYGITTAKLATTLNESESSLTYYINTLLELKVIRKLSSKRPAIYVVDNEELECAAENDVRHLAALYFRGDIGALAYFADRFVKKPGLLR